MGSLALVHTPADRLRQLADTANTAHRMTIRNALAAGQALLEAKKLLKHGEWRRWVEKSCVFSYRTARVYMQLARDPKVAGSANSLIEALESSRPSMYEHIRADERWFTPADLVEAARSAMGGIDLDPASEVAANRVVKANKFYGIRDDGLVKPWSGKVFLNPPYSTTKISKFIERLVLHVNDGRVQEAVVVVNSDTGTRWFLALAAISSAVCFPRGRVKFWKADATKNCPGPLATTVMYVGPRPRRFARTFAAFGHCWFA